MATIEIGNLYSKVTNASPEATRAMDTALAVTTPNCTFSPLYRNGMWDGMTRFYRKQGNKFPTGLLSEVVVSLRLIGEEPEIVDKRAVVEYKLPATIKLKDNNLGSITLRDYQQESVQKALIASRGVINVATNGGKTEIACGIIQSILPSIKKGERIVFFTHSKEIFVQSRKRLEERLGTKIGTIGDGKWDEQQITIAMIPTICKYVKEPKELPKVKKLKELEESLAVLQSAKRGNPDGNYDVDIKKASKELGDYRGEQWDKIKSQVKKTSNFLNSIVAFIGDEVHHAVSDTWYKVFMGLDKAYYRFGLTGTVDEDDEIGLKRLIGCTGKVVMKVSNGFLIENGYSAKPTIYMLPVPTKMIDRVDYSTARSDGIINCYPRNDIFVSRILERAKSGKQCLIIVNETEHGGIVLSMLENNGLNVKFSHGDKTGKYREQVLDELRDGSLSILIATTILDEGVDVSGINCLFLMAGGKSMKKLLQRIGRGLRKKDDGSGLEVYDALDYHNEYLVDHTLERYNTYKNEGFDIIKL